MTTTPTTTEVAPVANLAQARKEQAAAKRKAATTPKKPAAKKASSATTTKTASTKLRWTMVGEKDEKGRSGQTAQTSDGAKYVISGADKVWKATVTVNGRTTVLASDVSHSTAYYAAAHHFKAAQA